MAGRVEVAGGWVEERVLDPGNPADWEWRARPWEPHPGMWEKRPSAVKTKRGGPAGGGRWGEQGGRQVAERDRRSWASAPVAAARQVQFY